MGQPVVVDNRPGAGGTVGAAQVAKAKADGYTLLLGNVGYAAVALFYKNLPFEYSQDFTHITSLATVPNVLIVAKTLPVSNVDQLISYIKANPTLANYGSAGIGTTQHLAGELFRQKTGLHITHVPYKGAVPMMADIIGGRVLFALDSAGGAAAQLHGGNVKALAVTTLARTDFLQDVSTLDESGVRGYDMTTWYSLEGQKNLPADVTARLHASAAEALKAPGLRSLLRGMGASIGGVSTAEFTTYVAMECDRWGTLAKDFQAE